EKPRVLPQIETLLRGHNSGNAVPSNLRVLIPEPRRIRLVFCSRCAVGRAQAFHFVEVARVIGARQSGWTFSSELGTTPQSKRRDLAPSHKYGGRRRNRFKDAGAGCLCVGKSNRGSIVTSQPQNNRGDRFSNRDAVGF